MMNGLVPGTGVREGNKIAAGDIPESSVGTSQ